MQFENFDNRLKQAADQHHPEYDEKAWAKMEKLLDSEMPQKQDRRRRFLFFLLFLLVPAAILWILINKPWQSEEPAGGNKNKEITGSKTSVAPGSNNHANNSEETTTEPVQPITDNKEGDQSLGVIKEESSPTEGGSIKVSSPVADGDNIGSGITLKNTINNQKRAAAAKRKSAVSPEDNLDTRVMPGTIDNGNQPELSEKKPANPKTDKAGSANDPATVTPGNDMVTANNKTVTNPPLTAPATANDPTQEIKNGKEETPFPTNKKKATAKTQHRSNSLFLIVSAGPDLSFISLDNPGKTKLLTGAGIGYTFNDRWTVRTGFYSARKIYDAAPSDYKPATPVPYPNYLKNISANCKVYELPLSLAYNFGKSPRNGPFASVGLSSFIMKKEQYTYKYVYPTTTYYYTHNEDNKYKHYFSVLSLSGGYHRSFGKNISASVEPYLKLPLGGVGYGKVKLSSAGVLLSVNVHPFD